MNNYEELDRIAYEKFKSGESLTKISKDLKTCRGRLSKRLKSKYGVDIIPDGRKYSCNNNAFSSIDNEYAAYWLGFLLADGCVRNNQYLVELCLAEKDKGHLLKFKEFLKSDYKIIGKQSSIGNKTYRSCRTYVVSKQIVEDLAKYGCVQRKTYIEQPLPRFYDYDLDRALIRGFFDGDGSVLTKKNKPTVSRVSFTAYTENTLKDIVSFIEQYTGELTYKIHMRSPGSYNVNFNMDSARKVLFFMYNNSSIYLDRKYHIYKAYAVHIGNFMDYEWAKSVKPFVVGNAEESDSASVESRG